MLRENYFLEFFSHAHSDLFFQYAHTCMKNAHAHTHGCGLNANSSSVKRTVNPRFAKIKSANFIIHAKNLPDSMLFLSITVYYRLGVVLFLNSP